MRWFEGPGATRLAHDEAIVAELQPGLRHEVQADGSMAVIGHVVVRTRSGIPFKIPTRIEFPDGYPDAEPIAREPSGMFEHDADHHFVDDDRCCLWLDVESRWRRRDPDALRTFLAELELFYHRQLIKRQHPDRPFPGPQRRHGIAAYLDFLRERLRVSSSVLWRMRRALAGQVNRNKRCPCGSGIRYRKCHRDAVLEFRRRATEGAADAVALTLEANPGGARVTREHL